MTVQHDLFQEVMARLLFTLVTWVRQIPAFLVLPQPDQVRVRLLGVESLDVALWFCLFLMTAAAVPCLCILLVRGTGP